MVKCTSSQHRLQKINMYRKSRRIFSLRSQPRRPLEARPRTPAPLRRLFSGHPQPVRLPVCSQGRSPPAMASRRPCDPDSLSRVYRSAHPHRPPLLQPPGSTGASRRNAHHHGPGRHSTARSGGRRQSSRSDDNKSDQQQQKKKTKKKRRKNSEKGTQGKNRPVLEGYVQQESEGDASKQCRGNHTVRMSACLFARATAPTTKKAHAFKHTHTHTYYIDISQTHLLSVLASVAHRHLIARLMHSM